MSDPQLESPELPPPLAHALPAWRTDADVPDFAPAVLRRLREEPRSAPSSGAAASRPWRQAAWATLAAGLLIGSSVLWMEVGGGDDPVVAVADPTSSDVNLSPAPAPAPVLPPAEPEPVPLPPPSAAVVENAVSAPAATRLSPERAVALRDDLLPGDLFSADRLAQAWAVLPDPNRTWRDEVRDGVQPFRDGAETVATLFAEALPPPRRSY